MPGWKVGFMVNHPGDLNGKLANYLKPFNFPTLSFLLVAFLTDLENAGIQPSDVIFMCYGVNIVSDKEYGELAVSISFEAQHWILTTEDSGPNPLSNI
ncbi:hypothetical protein DAPPUDRAFT_244290 [Daphnia pulex]|uniref:Uncharacterized protein n=1 Tax=Daphnia pulex TaxID=6669 RepID=E9GKL9_DAPPU|nr:hypothetical protein DAPPUDRAFT_244290 [Daphnia pulex]|eukprot:EFX80014.1 hypothetical protein DAPPUDRAFT_244290 [Daphnia pulex]